MGDICLSKQEIETVTGKVKFTAQARALNMLGIDHKIRPDGSVLVFRADVPSEATKKDRPVMPNFDALNHVA